jgi:hypothetical protein
MKRQNIRDSPIGLRDGTVPKLAEHILVKALLKEGFETKLIASVALCSVRAVQRIRLKRQQLKCAPQEQTIGFTISALEWPIIVRKVGSLIGVESRRS